MRTVHRHAALVLAVGLVFVTGCEPLENLVGAFGSEEGPGESAVADDPEAAASEDAAEPPEAPEGPADEAAGVQDEAGEEAAGEQEEAGEETAPEEPTEGSGEDQSPEAPAAGATALCTAEDTMLSDELPPEAEHVHTATGDLTGDGQTDQLITYVIDPDDSPIFTLRVVTASGYIAERELEAAVDLFPAMPLGATALGGDREVAFVLQGSGASGFGVSLFALHDGDDDPCALLPVTIPDHTVPRMFPIGGTVGQASGLGCDSNGGVPTLTVTRAEQAADGGYEWMRTSWHWNDQGALEFVDDEQATFPEGDDLPGVGELDCDGIELP